MRCLACDAELSDREATRKGTVTGEFLDLCNRCFDTIKDQVGVTESSKFVVEESDVPHDLEELLRRE